MKHMMIFLSLLLMASCSDTKVGDDVSLDIVEVCFENHSYLVFKNPDALISTMSVVHNPNCKCDSINNK